MNKIKFAHNFCKLDRIISVAPVYLICVFLVKREELSSMFIAMDTLYIRRGIEERFKLWDADTYTFLIFSDEDDSLMTTIRRSEKYEKYKALVGQPFLIEVENDDKKMEAAINDQRRKAEKI